MVASTAPAPAAGARGPRKAPRAPSQTCKQCAWCLVAVDAKKARGTGGSARDPVDFACPHALHASCLRDWQYSVLTPGQRALVDTRGVPDTRSRCGSWRSPSTTAVSAGGAKRALTRPEHRGERCHPRAAAPALTCANFSLFATMFCRGSATLRRNAKLLSHADWACHPVSTSGAPRQQPHVDWRWARPVG